MNRGDTSMDKYVDEGLNWIHPNPPLVEIHRLLRRRDALMRSMMKQCSEVSAGGPSDKDGVKTWVNAFRRMSKQMKRVLLDQQLGLYDIEQDLLCVFAICLKDSGEFSKVRGIPFRDGQQWTPDEDEYIVEHRARGDSVDAISVKVFRTSQAVAARLTKLVGKTMDPKRVEGFLRGYLDEVGDIEGMFLGTVSKEKIA